LCLKASCVQDVVSGVKERREKGFTSVHKIASKDGLANFAVGRIAGPDEMNSGREKA
jgi:hypothetical protein